MPKRRPPTDPTYSDEVHAELDALYASLPDIECRGKCWDSCGSIGMTPLEQNRIQQRHQVTLPLQSAFAHNGEGLCPALTFLKRCSVYNDRPTVCRLWGLVRSMRCNYGCIPTGGFIEERDGYLLMARVMELSGQNEAAAGIRAAWEDPERAAQTEAQLRLRLRRSDIAWEVHQRWLDSRNSAIYVNATGEITKTPPEQVTTPRV